MQGRHHTFIAVPSDVSDSYVLKRFLDTLVQKIDIAFSKRGSGGFASETSIVSTAVSLEGLRQDVNNASGRYLLKDSSNLDELHYTTIPNLTSNTLIHKDYVDTLYSPQPTPSLLPDNATNEEVIDKINEVITKLSQSGIMV